MEKLIKKIREEFKNPYINKLIIGEHVFDLTQPDSYHFYIHSVHHFISLKDINSDNNLVIFTVCPPTIAEVITSIINKIGTDDEESVLEELVEAITYFKKLNAYKPCKFTNDDIKSIYMAIHSRYLNKQPRTGLDSISRIIYEFIENFINLNELDDTTEKALQILESKHKDCEVMSCNIEKWEDIK